MFKSFDEKIALAIEKVNSLKEEKATLERKVTLLEEQLDEKNQEVERLSSEKASAKDQVESILKLLETLDIK
ncbi:MAG: hypothetical protein HQL10_00810 [Nitrospirae bacterium]|nr:hypothetical protein [Nitrospirota bacterium]